MCAAKKMSKLTYPQNQCQKLALRFSIANMAIVLVWFIIPLCSKFTHRLGVKIINTLMMTDDGKSYLQEPSMKNGHNVITLWAMTAVYFAWDRVRRGIDARNRKAALASFEYWLFFLNVMALGVGVHSFYNFLSKPLFHHLIDFSWVITFYAGIHFVGEYAKDIKDSSKIEENANRVKSELFNQIHDSDDDDLPDVKIVVQADMCL